GVYPNRHLLPDRGAAVPGDMVGVRMRLEDGNERDLAPTALLEILLDRIGGIDEHCHPGVFVTDQVRGTPEIVVDELLEEHERDRSNPRGYISESIGFAVNGL